MQGVTTSENGQDIHVEHTAPVQEVKAEETSAEPVSVSQDKNTEEVDKW
jgi:hypothetical protein